MAVGSIFDVEKKGKHLGEIQFGVGEEKPIWDGISWSILTPTGRVCMTSTCVYTV
jgi:hypothetical protein